MLRVQQKTFHPLKQNWWLYYIRRGKHSDLEFNKKIDQGKIPGNITTLEQFLQYYHYIKKPSQLPVDVKIMYFKKNCEPKWEKWSNSGCFLINYNTKNSEQMQQLNEDWERLTFNLIGNCLSDNIVGIAIGTREKITLVQIWLDYDQNASAALEKLRKLITHQPQKIKYKRHEQSMKNNSTIKGNKKIFTIE